MPCIINLRNINSYISQVIPTLVLHSILLVVFMAALKNFSYIVIFY